MGTRVAKSTSQLWHHGQNMSGSVVVQSACKAQAFEIPKTLRFADGGGGVLCVVLGAGKSSGGAGGVVWLGAE